MRVPTIDANSQALKFSEQILKYPVHSMAFDGMAKRREQEESPWKHNFYAFWAWWLLGDPFLSREKSSSNPRKPGSAFEV